MLQHYQESLRVHIRYILVGFSKFTSRKFKKKTYRRLEVWKETDNSLTRSWTVQSQIFTSTTMLCRYDWRCSTSPRLCNQCVDRPIVHRPLLYLLILLKLHAHYPLDQTYGPRQAGHFGTVDHTPGNYGSAPWEWSQYSGICTKGQPLLCMSWLYLNISCLQTMWEMLGINALVDNFLEIQISVCFGVYPKCSWQQYLHRLMVYHFKCITFLLVFFHNYHDKEQYKNAEW